MTSPFYPFSSLVSRLLHRSVQPLLITGLALALNPAAVQAQCNQLVWGDEFNTDGDLTKWRVYEGDGCETGLCGFGNNELQVYRAANATVTGGNLNITTRFQNSVQGNRSYNYTSAKLFSKTPTGALQTFTYGRIEARIKLPSAQGVWPAFWMLANPNNWPTTGEIDIMEAKHRNPRSVEGTIHYNSGGARYTTRTYTGTADLSAAFHVYTVEWEPGRIRWYIDNTLFHTATPQTTIGGVWPFDNRSFYIMLNAAVGGPNTPFTNNTSPTPGDYPTTTQVDYVRVYAGAYSYAVNGAGNVLLNQTTTYTVNAINGATYTWAVPAGATITAGQGTNTITVNWGPNSGNVTVATVLPGCPPNTYAKAVVVTIPPVGPNLALRKPIFASSSESANFAPALAVDSSLTTRWASAFTDSEWLYVDLQNNYNLNRIILHWEAAYARNYQLQTSTDGITWTPCLSTTTGDGGIDDISVTATGRYVRFLGQRRATAYGYSLFEMEVYGTAVSALGTASAAATGVRLYPNPVADWLTVEMPGTTATTLTLADVTGRTVQQQAVPAGQNAVSMDLRSQPAGLYWLMVRNATGTQVQKIMKQ